MDPGHVLRFVAHLRGETLEFEMWSTASLSNAADGRGMSDPANNNHTTLQSCVAESNSGKRYRLNLAAGT